MITPTESLTRGKPPTPEEQEAIAEVWAVAREWNARGGSLADVRRATSGYQRFLASVYTPPDDPMFRPLMNLLDALIAAQGAVPTKHGLVDPALLSETQGTLNRATGDIRFPVNYDNGRGVFRPQDKRGPTVRPFSDKIETPTEHEREWWRKRDQ
jgi:hypothetical protein